MREFDLIIPAYNEAQSLTELVERTVAAATAHGMTPETFRLILVENGSTDQSRQVLQEVTKSDLGKWLVTVLIDINEGYGNGLRRGLEKSFSTYVGYTHADLQCDPADPFKALKILKSSAASHTLVKGIRSGRDPKDAAVSRVFEFFARVLLGLKVYEINAMPKVFPRELLGRLAAPPRTFAFDIYLLFQALRAGYNIQTIPVDFPPRKHGVSKWASNTLSRYRTILGMIRYMIRLACTDGRI